jgi:hypothetical protein
MIVAARVLGHASTEMTSRPTHLATRICAAVLPANARKFGRRRRRFQNGGGVAVAGHCHPARIISTFDWRPHSMTSPVQVCRDRAPSSSSPQRRSGRLRWSQYDRQAPGPVPNDHACAGAAGFSTGGNQFHMPHQGPPIGMR